MPALRPGLWFVDRFGVLHDVLDTLETVAAPDLAALAGYGQHVVEQAALARLRRARDTSRELDLRDVEEDLDGDLRLMRNGLPVREAKPCAPIPCPPYVTLGEAPPPQQAFLKDGQTLADLEAEANQAVNEGILKRIKEGLENLPAEGKVEDLPPHIREAVDEALANPEAFVRMRGRPGSVVVGSGTDTGADPDLNTPPVAPPEDSGGVRPAMPWDSDGPEDAWAEIGGTGA